MAEKDSNMPDSTATVPASDSPQEKKPVVEMPDQAKPVDLDNIPDPGNVTVSSAEIDAMATKRKPPEPNKSDTPSAIEADKKGSTDKSPRSKDTQAPDAPPKTPWEKTTKKPAPKKTREARLPKGPAAKDKALSEEPEKPPEPEAPPAPRDASEGVGKEEVIYLNLSELHAFKNHPFGVRDDAEMRSLAESVKTGGVNQAIIVRPREKGGFEIISGHRRHMASELAGYANIPCIVRNYNDDEAILKMTDDNLRQRSVILPSEKARSLKMQVDAITHQGAKGELGDIAKGDLGKRSTEIVGERNAIDGKPMNSKQVQRYIRLTQLVPELLDLADKGKLSFTPAVEISFIGKKNQQYIAIAVEGQQSSPSLAQAQKMRELDRGGKLTPDIIDGIMCEEKKEVEKVIINSQELSQFFGKDKTPREMKDQIMALLGEWKAKQPPELTAPVKIKEAEK